MFDSLLSDKEKKELDKPENQEKKAAWQRLKVVGFVGVLVLLAVWAWNTLIRQLSKQSQFLVNYIPGIPRQGQFTDRFYLSIFVVFLVVTVACQQVTYHFLGEEYLAAVSQDTALAITLSVLVFLLLPAGVAITLWGNEYYVRRYNPSKEDAPWLFD